MDILGKHKKKEFDGFKKFTMFLETTSPEKAREIIEIALIEDPLYMKYVIKNMRGFKYFNQLNSESLQHLHDTIKNPLRIFACALINSPYEETFLKTIPAALEKRYREEASLTANVTKSQQEAARTTILETIFKLEEDRVIQAYPWMMPDIKIIKGEHYSIEKGLFTSYYEDGKLALKGNVRAKMRHGLWEHYYQNGNLLAKGSYENGEKSGEWEMFYPNGTPKAAGKMDEDLKSGLWDEYDEKGNVASILYMRGKRMN